MLRGVIFVLLSSSTAWAQGSAPSSLPPAIRSETSVAVPNPSAGRTDGMVETDPIRCWWRTSAGAVRIGEPFTLTLTCAVLDDEAVQVVPDESRLSAAVVQLAPFEVVGGTHPADLGNGARRYFQYHYTLRIISPDAIGKDVSLPNFDIAYRVTSRLPGNTAQEGRELSYLLPPHAVRVVSTVPEEASDIRDSAAVDFGRIEALTFRSGLLRVLGWAFMALGTLMTLLALVALARRSTRKTTAGARLLSDRAVAAVAAAELADVQREAESAGWSESLVERALAASRVAAAGALGAVVHQSTAASGDVPLEAGEGRLITRGRLTRRRTTALSASTTSEDLARRLAQLPDRTPATRRQQIEDLRGAMTTFSAALYSPASTLDRSALDQAIASAVALARHVKSELNSPLRLARHWVARAPESEQHA